MSSHLDPVIPEKLQAFARRRRRLILLRGGLAALATLVSAMILVAALDYWFPLLPDGVRWALSGTAYGAVFVVVWRKCLRPLLHAPNERELARLVEHAEPGLREDLLSAVELGRNEDEIFDSEQFRALLQSDVSARIQDLKIESLLPVRLIRRSISIAAVIGLAVVAFMLLSDFRFGTLFLRALMPGSDLERASATKIVIIKPKAGDMTVPQGDLVRLEIELQGTLAATARLESDSATAGRMVEEMLPLGDNRFAATIQVGRESVRYRVQAGDALTRRYELTAIARPHEIAFEKTFHFPAYSQIPPETVREDHGDLTALEGTEVELVVTTNQTVAAGEVRIDRGLKPVAIPLAKLPDGRLGARVPLTGSGTYRLHLIAAGTGFENKFSPEYELRAVPDLLPIVEIEEPNMDLIVPADELVQLSGHAGDDIGIAKIVQMVQVNEEPWKVIDLASAKARPGDLPAPYFARVHREWDLSEEGVKAGSVITSKLVATDFKGSTNESRPLHIIIVAAGAEMNRLAGLTSRKALDESIKALDLSAAALEAAAHLASLAFEQPDGPGRREALAACAAASMDYRGKLSLSWMALDTPLRNAPANHESSDLVLLGRLLSRLNSGEAQPLDQLLGFLDRDPAMPAARGLVQEIHEGAARIRTLTGLAREFYQFGLAAEQIDVTTEQIMVLGAEQRRTRALAERIPVDWGKVAGRLRAVMNVSRNMDSLLEDLKTGGGPLAVRAEGLLNSGFFQENRERLEAELDAGPTEERWPGLIEDLTRELAKLQGNCIGTRERLAEAARDAIVAKGKTPAADKDTPAGLIASMHQHLLGEVGPTWMCLASLPREQALIAKFGGLSPETRRILNEARWNGAANLLTVHADLEEVRTAADTAFVGDLRRATVALQSTLTLFPGAGTDQAADRLEVVDQCLRILEAGHNLQEMLDGVIGLTWLERWEQRLPHGKTVAPRDWGWIGTRLRMAPDQLRGLDLQDGEARKAVASAAELLAGVPLSEPFLAMVAEMTERRKSGHRPQNTQGSLNLLAGRIKAALATLEQPMQTARTRLAELTPQISELALALAREEAELKRESLRLAGRIDTNQPTENQDSARPQLARQEQINVRIETLKDLIRADANTQDILQKDQRERMRDADDALATLKDPPPAAAQALSDVVQGLQTFLQQADLDLAVEQEQNVVDALNRIANHYEALEQGTDPAETRLALREAEVEAGIREQLDEQYARAEMLAQMAAQSPEELLRELEEKLPLNPEMQKELDQISRTALEVAREELDRAVQAEGSVVRRVDVQTAKDLDPKTKVTTLEAARLAATHAQEASAAADSAREAAEQAANDPALAKAREAAEGAAAALAAAKQLLAAAEAMTNGRNAEAVQTASDAVRERGSEVAQLSSRARGGAKPAAAIATKEAEKGGPQQAGNQQAAQQATRSAEESALAIEAANQAREAARVAAENAQAMALIPQEAPINPNLALATLAHQPVEPNASEAAADVARASRHEKRLYNWEVSRTLAELADQIDHTVHTEVAAADAALRQSQRPGEAQSPAQKSLDALLAHAEALKEASEASPPSSPPPSPSGEPSDTPTPAEQEQMARALDELDQQLNAGESDVAGESPAEGEAPGSSGPPGPPSPMGGMAQAAMASMRQGRSPLPSPLPGAPTPGDPMEKSEGGADFAAAAPSPDAPPELQAMKKGDWGRLPKKLAEQLSKGQAESIPGDYREAVETYYRVVAEKSRNP